jgi:tRNA1Val (adenine37-N6)-methyltransferase
MILPPLAPDESLDPLFRGKLRFIQKRQGYRFSMDAVILAKLTAIGKGDRVLDLGTGCGVIPLILALDPICGPIVGIEIQPELVDLARRNVLLNGQEKSIRILEMNLKDIREHLSPGSFDVVVSNPPFGIPGTGRISPRPQKAVARHEIEASLEHVLDAAYYALKTGGKLSVIYPVFRLARLIGGLKVRSLEPKVLRMIHARRNSEAQLVIIQAVKGGGEELTVLKPLYIYRADGSYTKEMEGFYST